MESRWAPFGREGEDLQRLSSHFEAKKHENEKTRSFIVCQSQGDPVSTWVWLHPSYLQKAEAKPEKEENALQKKKCSCERMKSKTGWWREETQTILKAFSGMRLLHRTVSFLQRHTVNVRGRAAPSDKSEHTFIFLPDYNICLWA